MKKTVLTARFLAVANTGIADPFSLHGGGVEFTGELETLVQ